jgi:hypothetical protein
MSAPTYSAALTFQVPIGTEYFRGRPCYRVIADVTAVTGFTDDRLFVHRRIAPPNSAAIDEFIGVAGPVDIVDFTDTPDANGYFRKNRVDMLLESHYLYDAVVNTVTSGVQELVNSVTRLEHMRSLTTVNVVATVSLPFTTVTTTTTTSTTSA